MLFTGTYSMHLTHADWCLQFGVMPDSRSSGWEDDKNVKVLVTLVGAIAFQQEIEAGEYTQKKRPSAGAIEEQLRGGGTPTLGAAQANQLAHGGYNDFDIT